VASSRRSEPKLTEAHRWGMDWNPVCTFHGKRWSEHEGGRCLFCCICFDTSPEGWATDSEGTTWDVCDTEECRTMAGIT
jgi:hypothetical protein